MRDYYDCENYFSDDEWENAAKSMSLCLEDTPKKEDISEQKQYWMDKIKFFRMLNSNSELEASEKLIKSLESHEH